jgi:hypothetical protein
MRQLMQMYISDYLEGRGKSVVISQEIIYLNDLEFIASCSLNKDDGPFIEISLGVGYRIAKTCFNFLPILFGKDIEKLILDPFSAIEALKYNAFDQYKDSIEKLDIALQNTLQNLKNCDAATYDYWYRLFEYSLGFIVLHELGHYLNGHCHYFNIYLQDAYKNDIKVMNERHTAELQSDIFAIQFILSSSNFFDIREDRGHETILSFDKVGDEKWIQCVSYSIFLMFIVLEKLSSAENISSHPKAIIRIINSLKHITGVYKIFNGDSIEKPFLHNFDKSLELCANILINISEFAKPLQIETSKWIESLNLFWGRSDFNSRINQNTDVFRLIELQVFSITFRYKLGRQACNALSKFSEDNKEFQSIIQLIVLSGNQIPWSFLHKKNEFSTIALRQISFDDTRVINTILKSKNGFLYNNRKDLLKISKYLLKENKMKINETQIEIEKFLQYSEQEIFSEIGEQVTSSNTLRWSSKDDKGQEVDKFTLGKVWYNRIEETLHKKICYSKVYNLFVQDQQKFDKTILCASIADLISGVCIGVSPIVVAVLIFKQGLIEFCKNTHAT